MMALVQNVAPELTISARDTGWGFASAHQDSKKVDGPCTVEASSRSCGVDLFPAFPGWSAPPARATGSANRRAAGQHHDMTNPPGALDRAGRRGVPQGVARRGSASDLNVSNFKTILAIVAESLDVSPSSGDSK